MSPDVFERLPIGKTRGQFIAEPGSPPAGKKHRYREDADERNKQAGAAGKKALWTK